MREIKFKLVHKNVIMGNVELKPGGIIDVAYVWDTAYQYTGLKDKNGKEIYESDIIEMEVNIIDGYDPAFAGEITHNENLHYKIVMGDVPEWLKLVPITDDDDPYACENYSWWLDENPEIEIIGNVHENPELLNES